MCYANFFAMLFAVHLLKRLKTQVIDE